MVNWEGCAAVERRPGTVSGAWVFAGTRVPLASLYENLACSATVEQFVEWFPWGGGPSGQVGSRIRGEDTEGVGAAVRLVFDRGNRTVCGMVGAVTQEHTSCPTMFIAHSILAHGGSCVSTRASPSRTFQVRRARGR